MKKIASKIKWKAILIVVVVIAVVGLAAKFALNRSRAALTYRGNINAESSIAPVERRDIETILSSSGTIQPLNTYEVTTLVEGEVIAANFEEGDYIEKGQVLYQIATEELDKHIDTAETNVTRAEKKYKKAKDNYDDTVADYKKALADYEDAASDYGDANLTASDAGIVKTVFVEEGDMLQKGSQIAEIYDNRTMILEVPFNAAEADQSLIGKSAKIIMSDSFETLKGTVTKVSNIDEVLAGNRLVRTVTIEVQNPGGLSAESMASAVIGKIYSSGEGSFEVKTQKTLTAKKAGEIYRLNIEEGSSLKEGDILLTFEEKSVEDQLESYKKQLENAEDAVQNAKDSVEAAEEVIEDAKTSLEEVTDTREDYSITAPISGQIVSKNALEGDTITAKSILCTIYDLSAAVFDMYIDELDIMNVKAGQEVKITADAFEAKEFSGAVTSVSLQSSASGGVTQFPVTVRINDRGDLLPGMNVTGKIVLDKVENVIAVPSEALMRGDVIYVADPTVTEAVGEVPAGFREVPVETGMTDGDYIEIKSGLNGDEEVYVKRVSGTDEMMFMPGGMGGGTTVEYRIEDGGGEAPRNNGRSQARPRNGQ
ncbi:MAG: HlyD family efflux transporter periplasmic adaptor subunit [Lachnospiraceae bacterium]|nr:HlyD family efflux transporter periplasmic adaptor subunit [Lachnospiraceae bacterium]